MHNVIALLHETSLVLQDYLMMIKSTRASAADVGLHTAQRYSAKLKTYDRVLALLSSRQTLILGVSPNFCVKHSLRLKLALSVILVVREFCGTAPRYIA